MISSTHHCFSSFHVSPVRPPEPIHYQNHDMKTNETQLHMKEKLRWSRSTVMGWNTHMYMKNFFSVINGQTLKICSYLYPRED